MTEPDVSPLPAAVLFDFSGTLFHVESALEVVLASLGPGFAHRADDLHRLGAINGSPPPPDLPAELRELWNVRDLSADAHREAYTGAALRAGLSQAQADALYARAISAAAWSAYRDTVESLTRLRQLEIPVAMVSNIGWNPRPVLDRHGVTGDIDAVVLSYEHGVQKPDAGIFEIACAELDVDPGRCVMVGDTPEADGGSVAAGIPFVEVPRDPARRSDTTLLDAALGHTAPST